MRFRGGKQMQKEATQRENGRDAGEVVKVSMTEGFGTVQMLGTSALRPKEYSYFALDRVRRTTSH